MTSTGPKDQDPLPPLLLALTVVTGVVTAGTALAVRRPGPWRAG